MAEGADWCEEREVEGLVSWIATDSRFKRRKPLDSLALGCFRGHLVPSSPTKITKHGKLVL